MDPENNPLPTNEEFLKLKAESERILSLVQNLNEENQSLKKRVEAFGSISPEEVKELKKKAQEAQLGAVSSDPDQIRRMLDEREREVREEVSATIRDLTDRLNSLQSAHHQVTVVSEALSKAPRVRDDMRDFFEQTVQKHVDRDSTSGKLVVKDDGGRVRYSPSNPAQLMTLDEFYAEVKRSRPSMFEPEKIQTGGIPQGQMITGAPPRNLASDGVDWARVEAGDAAYIQSLPRPTRVAIYKKLGV